jgi:hypothetical protein
MTETWVILPRQGGGGADSSGVHEDKDNRLRQMNGRIARAIESAGIAVARNSFMSNFLLKSRAGDEGSEIRDVAPEPEFEIIT